MRATQLAADAALRAQYEAFPYPTRDPADERHRLLATMLEGVPSINHYVFGGELDPRKTFRALIAGGGTGDALIYLAQQFHDLGIASEITYVDLSDASPGERIALARRLLKDLPESNWLKRNPRADYDRLTDTDLFDLLLHSKDRPYTVERAAELVDGRRSLDDIRGQLAMDASEFDAMVSWIYPFLHDWGYLHLSRYSLNLDR